MSEIEVVLLCVFVAVITALVTWKISERFHSGVFGEMLDRLDISEEQLKGMVRTMAEEVGLELTSQERSVIAADEIHIRIEQDGTELYAYRKDSSEFIGQGTDREALLARLVTQFPKGARLIVDEEDGAALIKE